MTAAYHHTGFFSIKNPTIESEVSWSSLLSFYTLEEQSFQQEPDGLREEALPQSLCLCHQAPVAPARWQ